MTTLRSAVALTLASTALLTSMAHADTPRVGVTSAVNPAAAGTPPGAASRQLVVGSDVVFRERVITTDEGQAQILFLDQSSLMVGPNSTVVIDEFVYDPNTGKGNIAATLTQGSFRYIGGKLSKQGNATLKTPVATIGIRGSDVTVTFDSAKNQADVVTTHGTASVQTLGGVLGLRTGFGTTINSADRPPAPPAALTAAQILAVNGQFEGKAGKSAGAPELPTDKKVSESGVGSAVEAQRLAAVEPAAGGPAAGQADVVQQLNGVVNQLNQAVTHAVQQQPTQQGQTGNVLPPPPPPPPPQPGPRTERTLNGFVAGFGQLGLTSETNQHQIINDLPTDVTIRTIPDADGIGRVHAMFNFRSVDAERLASAGIELGDAPGARPATQSVFFDNARFLASQAATTQPDKGHINGLGAGAEGALVSIGVGGFEGQNSILCTCEFVTWGVWQASLRSPTSDERVRVNQGLWVAGVLPNVGDPAPTGTATFNGTAIGFVQSQGTGRAASGTFTNTYNFAQRSGVVQIRNFDGLSFSGNVSAGNDWRTYSGTLSGSNLTGGVNGAFYGNRNAAGQLQPPKETAGNFHVGGAGYAASGIFVGSR